uniref:Uncharacterized protein n=1 Tax=Bosea sp. NBC_00436 TaxID=2969620 RepID=A0A9E8A7S0_9HYPH
MSTESDFPAPATMAARLGSHLLLSLGIAMASTVLVAAPALLSDAAPDHAKPPTLTLLRDGKIADRLAEAGPIGDDEPAAGRPLLPAALAMPLSLAWPEQGDWTPPRIGSQAKTRVATSTALQPRRLAVISEKKGQAMAPPLVILPPAAMTAMEPMQVETSDSEGADSSLRQFVVTPAMKVVDAVSGAAGSMQAAGSWTLNQANGLLPRW